MDTKVSNDRQYRPAGAPPVEGDFVVLDGEPVGMVGTVYPDRFEVLGMSNVLRDNNIPCHVPPVVVLIAVARASGLQFYHY